MRRRACPWAASVVLLVLMLPAIAIGAEEPPAPVQVVLRGGETLSVRSARSVPFDVIALVMPDSTVRYVPAVRIRRIVDSDGRDRTKEVFDRGAVAGVPIPGVAGEPTTSERLRAEPRVRGPHIPALTWRGHPYPETRSFLITELGVMYRLDRYPYAGSTSRAALTFDLGWMKNISTRDAVGFSGYAMPADQTTRLGVRARYRRWLTRGLSLDLSPGVILGGEDAGMEYSPPGFVLGATVNAGDWVAVMVDAEYARNWDYEENTIPFLTRRNHTDVTWRAGLKLGSGLGLVGSAAVIGLVLAAAASGAFE